VTQHLWPSVIRLWTNYTESLQKTVQGLCSTPTNDIVVRLKDDPTKEPSSGWGYKLSQVHPLRQLSLKRFSFELHTVAPNLGHSWEETFLYEEGRFRLVGLGAWPFWAFEDGAGPGVSKYGHLIVHPAQVIHQVPATYPAAALAKRVEGAVELHVVVDKEGKAKKVDLMKGDPLLVDAAIEAVRHWRFKPSTMGDMPIESVLPVIVNFQRQSH
jgi:TonB family protein